MHIFICLYWGKDILEGDTATIKRNIRLDGDKGGSNFPCSTNFKHPMEHGVKSAGNIYLKTLRGTNIDQKDRKSLNFNVDERWRYPLL